MTDLADYRIGNPGNHRMKKVRNDFAFQTFGGSKTLSNQITHWNVFIRRADLIGWAAAVGVVMVVIVPS